MVNRSGNLLGLPSASLNFLSFGGGVFLILAGFKIINSNDVSMRVANAQLITSSSARELTELANKLDEQAQLIEQKDLAYQQLDAIYQRSLKGKDRYGKLQNAIETVGELPQVQKLDELQSQINLTLDQLQEIQE